jgi:hypothetical protein
MDAQPSTERPAEPLPIPVAPADDGPTELVSETWRLTVEAFPTPQRQETPAETAPAEDEPAEEAHAAPAEPAAAAADPAPGADSLVLDSPADATLILSRSEVEAALGLGAAPDGGAQYELAEPGTGTDESFAEALAADAAGGREFEIEEPAPKIPEPAAAEPLAPAPPLDLAEGGEAETVEAGAADLEATSEDEAGQTGEIPREVVVRALGGTREEAARPEAAPPSPPGPEATAPSGSPGVVEASPPPEDPIADLERAITRFNHLHRVLYRAIRSEVGAGAANFIHACRVGLAADQGEIFQGSRLLPDGTWDPEGLRQAVRERTEHGVWSGFEGLLARELEMLRPQIDEARAQALREQLGELERIS